MDNQRNGNKRETDLAIANISKDISYMLERWKSHEKNQESYFKENELRLKNVEIVLAKTIVCPRDDDIERNTKDISWLKGGFYIITLGIGAGVAYLFKHFGGK